MGHLSCLRHYFDMTIGKPRFADVIYRHNEVGVYVFRTMFLINL